MCAKDSTHMYVARTSNNKVIMTCELYCCLLPQCEALLTCRSGFPIATVVKQHRNSDGHKCKSRAIDFISVGYFFAFIAKVNSYYISVSEPFQHCGHHS